MPRPQPQSSLFAPFNVILGTEANVRLLRVLALAGSPLAAGELAKRAKVSRTNIYPALKGLESTGIVEFVGSGAQRQVAFRQTHPLAGPIATLFSAEVKRVDMLVAELRGVFRSLKPQPMSAWLDGLGDSMSLFVVGDPQTLGLLTDEVSERVGSIERTFGVHVDVRGLTRSELASLSPAPRERLGGAMLLAGVPPTALLPDAPRSPRRNLYFHGEHDESARRLGVAIAAKLKWDPGLVELMRRRIADRARWASPQEQRELKEWLRIIDSMPPVRLQRFLVEPSERATRLRQTLPALDILTPAEREAVLASSSDDEARAVVLGRR